jgi:hypothetical protein
MRKLSGIEKVGVGVAVVLVMVILLAYGGSSDTQPNEQSQAPQIAQVSAVQTTPQFKAEDIVRFPKSNVACLTKEGLAKFMQYGVSGESTKMKALLVAPENEEGECVMLDPVLKYKIIHAEYNDPAHPDMGLAEVVGASIKSASHGAWILTMMAELVPQ